MDLEGTMLSEKHFDIIVCTWNLKKKADFIEIETLEWSLPGAEGRRKCGEVSQRVQTFSYQINEF